MAKASPKTTVLPLVPLPRTIVLLPGVTTRIPLQNRADIAAILANIYSKASIPRPDASSVTVGCVPLNSRYLSADGKQLIDDGDKDQKAAAAAFQTDPAQARKPDLFNYGTVARVTGVQGRQQGQLVLVVEGVRRFKVEKVLRERPYFEARVAMHEETPVQNDAEVAELFAQLKQLSRELIALIRLSSLCLLYTSPSPRD